MNACCSSAAFLDATEGLFFIGKLQRTIKLVWIKTDEYLNFSFPEGPVAHKDSTAIIMQCPCQYLTSTSTTFIHLFTDTGKLKLGEPLQFVCSLKDFSKKRSNGCIGCIQAHKKCFKENPWKPVSLEDIEL